jgi:hypothetical protein
MLWHALLLPVTTPFYALVRRPAKVASLRAGACSTRLCNQQVHLCPNRKRLLNIAAGGTLPAASGRSDRDRKDKLRRVARRSPCRRTTSRTGHECQLTQGRLTAGSSSPHPPMAPEDIVKTGFLTESHNRHSRLEVFAPYRVSTLQSERGNARRAESHMKLMRRMANFGHHPWVALSSCMPPQLVLCLRAPALYPRWLPGL